MQNKNFSKSKTPQRNKKVQKRGKNNKSIYLKLIRFKKPKEKSKSIYIQQLPKKINFF